MKLIDNWQDAHKALSVILPTLGSVITLLIFILQKAGELNLIPNEYIPLVTATIVPFLAWVGRIIPQATLLLGKIGGHDEQKNNT